MRFSTLGWTIFLTLGEIGEDKRKASQQLMADFERVRPAILGALLTAMSRGLRNLPSIKLERLPRMADFAKWATACESVPGTFAKAYNTNRSEAVETVIEADPVATALCQFMANRDEWEGTASELLGALSLCISEGERRGRLWPTAPNKLSGRLRRQAPFLRHVGIEIGDTHRKDKIGSRKFKITKAEGNRPSEPSGPSDKPKTTSPANDLAPDDSSDDGSDDRLSSESTVRPNPLKNNDSDDADVSDDRLPPASPLIGVCAYCGEIGGIRTAHGPRLHPECQQPWIERKNEEAVTETATK